MRTLMLCSCLYAALLLGCSSQLDYETVMTPWVITDELCETAELPLGRISSDEVPVITGYISRGMKSDLETMQTSVNSPVVLYNSPGGYVAPAMELAHSRRPIRITGQECHSACVMILIESDDACVTDTVKLLNFHSITVRQCVDGRVARQLRPKSTRDFIRHVREPLRSRLWHLAEEENFEPVSLKDFLAVYPEKRCVR